MNNQKADRVLITFSLPNPVDQRNRADFHATVQLSLMAMFVQKGYRYQVDRSGLNKLNWTMEIRLLLPEKHILKNMRKCITVPILNSCVGDSYKATCEREFRKHNILQIFEDMTNQNSWTEGNWWQDEDQQDQAPLSQLER